MKHFHLIGMIGIGMILACGLEMYLSRDQLIGLALVGWGLLELYKAEKENEQRESENPNQNHEGERKIF